MTLGRGILVSAARSGAGKTVVTIGLQRALFRAGHRVAGAKAGPDFIDPAFHAAATGRPSLNLDGFALGPRALKATAAGIASTADLVVAEGGMGLYDGLTTATRSGTAASVATTLDWPVLLVLDASGSAQTVAAVAHGLAQFPGAPRIAGVILNRIGSARHRAMISAGFEHIAIPLLGSVPTDPRLSLPSRHLGLVQAGETTSLDDRIDGIADVIAEHCDLMAIAAAAAAITPADAAAPTVRPLGQRTAVGRDDAFAFLYPHLLDGWRNAGAEITFFSPLADESPPLDCDACWLPGGYPELHAGRLASNLTFLDGVRAFAARGRVHGECGGYMVLGQMLEDAEGKRHAMAGLLPVETSFAKRRLHLGYRQATWRHDMGFASANATSWGHEYHHASVIGGAPASLTDISDGEGAPLATAGHRAGKVTGSFFHVIA